MPRAGELTTKQKEAKKQRAERARCSKAKKDSNTTEKNSSSKMEKEKSQPQTKQRNKGGMNTFSYCTERGKIVKPHCKLEKVSL